MKMTLPTDSDERKGVPLFSGVLKYAPAALAGVARISKRGNDKHNPGQEMHHARGKSADHADCILRHAVDVADIEAHIVRNFDTDPDVWAQSEDVKTLLDEVSQLAWRALMWSQDLHERYGRAPLAPGARLPGPVNSSPVPDTPSMRAQAAETVAKKNTRSARWHPTSSFRRSSLVGLPTCGTTICVACGGQLGDHSADSGYCQADAPNFRKG
jgi:hypothetical protein